MLELGHTCHSSCYLATSPSQSWWCHRLRLTRARVWCRLPGREDGSRRTWDNSNRNCQSYHQNRVIIHSGSNQTHWYESREAGRTAFSVRSDTIVSCKACICCVYASYFMLVEHYFHHIHIPLTIRNLETSWSENCDGNYLDRVPLAVCREQWSLRWCGLSISSIMSIRREEWV